MRIITAAAIKGGSGKTTTAAALAQAAAAKGRRTLCIDLDPQANFTYITAADQNRPGSYQLLNGTPAVQLIQTTPQGVDVIAASPDLATVQTHPGSAKRLETALRPVAESYDLVFIDTPPTLGELVFNALQASTGLIVPLETDANNMQGLYQIVDLAHQMQRSNAGLRILGTVLTRFDNRPKINRFMREAIEENGQAIGAPFLLAIRPGIAVREAQAVQRSLYDYAPKSKPAQDYMQLYKIITKED